MENFIKSIEISRESDSNTKYHSKSEYIGASGLKLIKKSPLHFRLEERTETDAMFFGSAYHKFILEPDKFEDEYFILDEKEILGILISEGSKSPRATNKYKDWKSEQEVKAGSKIIIDIPTYSVLKEMRAVLFNHKYVKSLLSNGVSEESFYAEITTLTGKKVKVKIKPDYLKENKRIIVDLKTCASAEKNDFSRHAADLDYHIQSALYTDIIQQYLKTELGVSFFFIAQEKVKPYAFNIFEASPQFQAVGRNEYEQLLLLYQYCAENNVWPGYQCFCENKYGILELNLPAYAIKEINWFIHK